MVWRPVNANWYLHASSGASPNPLTFGLPGDVPVWGDFDGDGKADYAAWRPATATWLILESSTNTAATPVTFGLPADIPIPGDFNGDGITDYAVWRPSNQTWYVQLNTASSTQLTQYWANRRHSDLR